MNRFDVENGITLSRKNHGLAENQKIDEFSIFTKRKLGYKYNKMEQQKNILGIPFDYEALFFGNFFECKKQELEDYYKFNGIEVISKKDLILKVESKDSILKLKEASKLKERVFTFCSILYGSVALDNLNIVISDHKVYFYYLDDKNNNKILFELYVYELLKEELEYVYRCIV